MSARAIRDDGAFGVSVLGREHVEAARASGPARGPKLDERFWQVDELERSVAARSCRPAPKGAIDVADHTTFFAGVPDAVLRRGIAPLVDWGRRYTDLHGDEPWYC